VHLFSFRRAKKFYFSSIKYISTLSSKTRSKSKLKYLLILSNRLLIFGLLVFSIWAILTDEKADATGPALVYFDNSMSSSISDGVVIAENTLERLIENDIKPIDYFDNVDRLRVVEKAALTIKSGSSLKDIRSILNRIEEQHVKENYLISDFQGASIESIDSWSFDSTKNYHFIFLDDLNQVRNVAIDSLWLQPNPDDLSKISIHVGFLTFNISSGNVVIKLMQGSRQISSIVKSISDLGIVEFDVPIEAYGSYSLEIEGDDVVYDNTFYFVIEERSKPTISILNNGSRAIEEVFSNELLFNTQILDIQNLDYEMLDQSDLVVLNSHENLPANLIGQFSDKKLLIFPSDSVNILTYNELSNLVFTKSNGVFEIDLETENELLKGVFERNADLGTMPRLSQIFTVSGAFEPIIKFRNGNPFLLSTESVYFFNTSLGSNSGFESNALFLPVLYQIAFSSVRGTDLPYYYPGNRIALNVKSLDNPARLKRKDYEIIPSFNSSANSTIIEIPYDIEPGIYHIVQAGDTLRQIAINLPKEESEMRSPKLNELEEIFSKHKNVQFSQAVSNDENVVFGSTQSVSLWKYALILAVLIILTETMLHRYLR
ncbi:MAG: BatA domain-containing protein, partial [Ekhidna sp.]